MRPKRLNFAPDVLFVHIHPSGGEKLKRKTIPQRRKGYSKAFMNAEPTSAGEFLGIAAPLLNRKPDGAFDFPSDNWYLIAPLGEHPHTDSGFVQVVDQKAVEAMANSMPKNKELLVDFEHESHNPDKRTTAAGWIQALENRDEGLWAQIRWSRSGKAALRGGDYRFISPVWTFGNCEQMDATHVRPLALSDAGLTNTPNLRGLAPLSNREAGKPQPHAEDTADESKQKEQMKKINEKLGLSADASEESALAAIMALENSAKRVSELEKKNDTLANSNRELTAAQAESDLNDAGINEPAERDTWKNQLIANRAGTLPLLASFVKQRGNATAQTLTNRGKAQSPNEKKEPAGEEKTQSQKIADAIANAKGATNEERFENARRANPELFKPAEANA